jgi:hypothetical protein
MKLEDFDLREPRSFAHLLDWARKAHVLLRALVPRETPTVAPELHRDGLRLHARGAGAGSGFPLRRCTVVTVNADTLTCTMDGGATTFTVHKPVDLRVAGYAAFDDAVLDAFESANTFPGSTPTDYAEYTQPVLMEAGSGALSDTRAVQQRYRLVYGGTVAGEPLPSGDLRQVVQEMVWPPYYASGGSAAGGVPGSGFASTLYEVWAAQDQNGEWMEVLPHRAWKDVHEVVSERWTYTDATPYGKLLGTAISSPGVAAR